MSSGIAEALGWALLNSLWQSVLIALGLAVALRALPISRLRLRRVAMGAALGLVVVALVSTTSLLLKDWAVHDACWSQSKTEMAVPAAPCLAHGVRMEGSALASPPASSGKARAVSAWAWIVPDAMHIPRLVAWSVRHATRILGAVALLSIALSCLLLCRLVYGLSTLRRICRTATPLRDARALTSIQCLADRMGIKEDVRLRESPDIRTPGVAGCRRPVILLPSGLGDALEADEMDDVLAHELAHVRRGDFTANLAQSVLDCILAYNPSPAGSHV